MGLMCKSVLMYPFSSLDTLTSKKFTVVSLMSAVNLIVSRKEFKASKRSTAPHVMLPYHKDVMDISPPYTRYQVPG